MNCLFCKYRSPLFSLLTDSELQNMNRDRQEVRYNPGETILKQGAPLTHVLSFNSGFAKMVVEGKGNRRLILQLVRPVEFICGMGLFSDSRNQFSVIAIEWSSVCYIPKEVFIETLHENRQFSRAFLKHIEDFQARNLSKLVSINQKHATGRIAEALLNLAGETPGSETFDTRLSTAELAELAGISRDSAFKVLGDLAHRGIIERDGSCCRILDHRKLATYSRNG